MGHAAGDTAGLESEGPEVYYITLEHGEHRDATLYRFEKGCYLQFVPGTSLMGRKVYLYTNYVVSDNEKEDGAEFVRSQYYRLEWRALDERSGLAAVGEGQGRGEGDALVADAPLAAQLLLRAPGAFHYYFVYDTPSAAGGRGAGSGWFQVAPALPWPLDAVACQTVLAKCLGPLTRWRDTLEVAHQAGYNMLHFTPVQVLGGSQSCYSLADQLRPDPRYGASFDELAHLLHTLRRDWQMLSICDVVLNHTANETAWVRREPAATYNCGNCPHLRPAALLDAALANLSADVAAGNLCPHVPTTVTTHQHIEAALAQFERTYLPPLRLHELLCCDVDALVAAYTAAAAHRVPARSASGGEDELRLVADPLRRRCAATVDMELALRLYHTHSEEEGGVSAGAARLRRRLELLNAAAARDMADHLRAALDNCAAGMRYFRVQEDGPKISEVSDANPLVPRYFTWPADVPLAQAEALVFGARAAEVMAHNGWVMDADPLQDFAAPQHDARVYLRRELIAWGDSVKFRYGDKPEDSPFLWSHMRQYVELTASVFDGVRLDNCHSTPLHVAEYLLDCARRVKPDLYVVAELFTNSDNVDNIFVNRLGITALIREALGAWDAHEQGRLVHRFGGRGVGAWLRRRRRPALPAVARALLMDQTHDNRAPLELRCVFDALPSAALVAVACCASGSTRGYDELFPHAVHVVDERRLYRAWGGAESDGGGVSADCGILAARAELNRLHRELAEQGLSEVFVDQVDADVVAVTRHHPITRESVILVAYTAFSAPAPEFAGRHVKPLRFEGQLHEIILEAVLLHKDYKRTGAALAPPERGAPAPRYLTGLQQYEARVGRAVPAAASRVLAAVERAEDATVLHFRPLLPGTVLAVRVTPLPRHAAALAQLHRHLGAAALARDPFALGPALEPLDPVDLNAVLYCCEAEERERTGGGVYCVPGHGPLVYAGLQGVVSLLEELEARDELSHPLSANLRAGDWLPEYLCARLERGSRLRALAACARAALEPVSRLPRFLVPAYFGGVVRALHAAAVRATLARLAGGAGGLLARALALCSVQLVACVPSAPLPAQAGGPAAPAPSLSAGLPHFATGYMRCWGRDTFIALRGTLLLTARYDEARAHILGFASCLRHGLIPNLLDGGRNARFNCRDAVWWWLLSVQQYCTEAPEGYELLNASVSRMFPRDDSAPQPPGAAPQPLRDVVQEALDRHFQGVLFRERRAGPDIDAHMTDAGFTVQLGIDPETGFPFGGNEANCGTWMDKMGSSERAGNRGRPATPRDGSAVELVALAYRCADWLAGAHAAGLYPHAGVTRTHAGGALTAWSWRQWADRLRRSFERHFWVPAAPSAADARPDLVHRRAIYKDSHGASQPWADYQLRCNYVVAMAVAPDLFDPKHAWLALDNVERLLLGPLGIKTLDPGDWAYRPDYDNSDDGTDASVAHGFNYHQGPEWVWPMGFYIRARLAFARQNGQYAKTIAEGYARLGPLAKEIETSPWRGLPELTNAGGAYCRDSCRTQAWSSGSALEALVELGASRRARRLPAD